MKRKIKPKITQIYYTDPENPKKQELVCNINQDKERIEYFLNPNSRQYNWIQKIIILGLKKLPAGFRRDGKGLTRGSWGYLILKSLYEELGDFGLTISTTKKNVIRKSKNKYEVTLNYFDFRSILDSLRVVKQEGYKSGVATAVNFLSKYFPKRFKRIQEAGLVYQRNQIRNLLNKEDVIENLSNEDIQILIDFFPKFINYYGNKFKDKKSKLLGITKNKKAAEIVYLENIIKKFESKLKAKTQSEYRWQEFFRNYILIFNSNYANIFEKKNLSLSGKYPDFLPIDAYGYLDIYEIKKPNTPLLKFDESRGNYYWSTELSKAISQVENYIYYANKTSSLLREEIKKKEKVEVKIVKPRGFIVAGTREQLKDEIIEDNFRLLNNSLKDIEIILYDDVLNNLKVFLKRLKR